jgi:hypothetical protein
MQFFDAWPLKVLMALLVTNLVVVTWRRIPLTPPRYGVWCVHAGIITLVLGTAIYYHLKVEGRVRLYVDPKTGLNTAGEYYDKDERALYVQFPSDVATEAPQEIDLPDLPRMKAYDPSLGNESGLAGRGLTGLEPKLMPGKDPNKVDVVKNFGEVMGWGHPVTFDVIGYFPYAQIETDFRPEKTGGATSIEITGKQGGKVVGDINLVASDWRFANLTAFGVDFRHVDGLTPEGLQNYVKSAAELFTLSISTTGPNGPMTDYPVTTGMTIALPGGYQVQVGPFDPAFSTHDSDKQASRLVKTLTLAVTSPNPAVEPFQRIVIDGEPKQTDFRLGTDGRPMGMGSKSLLDPNLSIKFKFKDLLSLMPRPTQAQLAAGEGSTIQHTILTVPNQPGFTDIVTGFGQATDVRTSIDPDGEQLSLDPMADQPVSPMLAALAANGADMSGTQHSIQLKIKRVDHVVPDESVRVVPKSKRNSNVDESGQAQVARVRVHFGDYSQDVLVPFSTEAFDGAFGQSPADVRWRGGEVRLPASPNPVTIRLQLGNRRRDLPCELTLNKFEAIPYPGVGTDFLDYKSTVTITEPETPDGGGGETITDVAKSNHPIYYDHGNWLFFQRSYDGTGKTWSELGVGNRPAINIMVAGCLMILTGLMYAFYAKPIIIRRMKEKAIALSLTRNQGGREGNKNATEAAKD